MSLSSWPSLRVGGGGGGLITDWSVFIMNLDQAPLGATHSGSKIAFFGSL